MAAGVLVVQPQVALLGSCEGHSWISWRRGAARGHSKQDPGEDAVSITFCSLVSSTDPLSCPDRNCLLRRIPNERKKSDLDCQNLILCNSNAAFDQKDN